MSFVADSTSEVLTIASFGEPYGMPPMSVLDGVSMTAAVPEPSSWAMLLLGCAVLGGRTLMNRRRSLNVAASR